MRKIIALLAGLLSFDAAHAQTTQTFPTYISGLPAAASVGSTDQFYVLQGGVSKRVSALTLLGGYLPLSGGTMSGPIAMGGNAITGVGNLGVINLVAAGSLPAISSDGAVVTSQNQNSISAYSIYNPLYGQQFYDGQRSVLYIPSASTAYQANIFGAYGQNYSTTTALVGPFSLIECLVNGAKCYGSNHSVIDSANGGINSYASTLVGQEIDLVAYNTSTTGNGSNIQFWAASSSPQFNGYQVSLSGVSGNLGKLQHSFVSNDGVSSSAFVVGANATSGSNVNSQGISFNTFNSSAAEQTTTLRAFPSGGSLSSVLESSQGYAASGYLSRSGTSGSYGGNYYNFYWTGSCLELFVDTTNSGCVFSGTDLTATGLTATAVAPTVSSNQIGYGSTVAAASSCGSLSGAAGCIVVNIAGTAHYVPYY